MKNVVISAVTAVITTVVVMFIMHSMNPECHGQEGCSKSKTECSKDGKKCSKSGKTCSKADAKSCKKDCTKPCCSKSADAKTCKKGCTKPCCAKKGTEVIDSLATEVIDEVEEIIEE